MYQIINRLIRSRFAIAASLLTSIFLVNICHATSTQPLLSAQHIKQDFAQLYEELQLAHYDLYANTSKQDYDAAYKEWLTIIDHAMSTRSSMTVEEVKILFQQFMALGDIAHARIDLPLNDFSVFLQNGGSMFPMFFRLAGNTAYIDTVYIDDPALQPDTQILAIDHKPVASWLADIRSYISADSRELSNTIIENTLPFYMWLMLGEQKTFTIDVKTATSVKQTVVNSVTLEQRQLFSRSTEQKQDLSTMDAQILEGNIGYLRPGPFYNTQPGAKDIWDNSEFVAFVDSAFSDFIEKDVKALVVDLRNNPGGTNSFSDPVIAWFAHKPFKFASEFVIKVSPQSIAANDKRLEISGQNDDTSQQLKAFYDSHKQGETFAMSLPNATPKDSKRFNKPVFVLINRYSYSNAVSFAAIVQDYGFGTVIGENSADFATTFGAMEHFNLTHSGITVGYPKALIIRPSGDKTPGGVMPDITLSTDPDSNLLEQALAYIKQQ